MTSFQWLNEVPADQWPQKTHGGVSWQMTNAEFRRRSDAPVSGEISREFDAWADDQEHRGYQLQACPPIEGQDAVWILMVEKVVEPGPPPGHDPRF